MADTHGGCTAITLRDLSTLSTSPRSNAGLMPSRSAFLIGSVLAAIQVITSIIQSEVPEKDRLRKQRIDKDSEMFRQSQSARRRSMPRGSVPSRGDQRRNRRPRRVSDDSQIMHTTQPISSAWPGWLSVAARHHRRPCSNSSPNPA